MDIVEKFLRHAFDPSKYGTQLITNHQNVAGRAMRMPICPRCERPALRDTRPYDPKRAPGEHWTPENGYITCPNCGYHGRCTHTVAVHIQEYVTKT